MLGGVGGDLGGEQFAFVLALQFEQAGGEFLGEGVAAIGEVDAEGLAVAVVAVEGESGLRIDY